MLQFKNLSLVCLLFFSQVHTSGDIKDIVDVDVMFLGAGVGCLIYGFQKTLQRWRVPEYRERIVFFTKLMERCEEKVQEVEKLLEQVQQGDVNLNELAIEQKNRLEEEVEYVKAEKLEYAQYEKILTDLNNKFNKKNSLKQTLKNAMQKKNPTSIKKSVIQSLKDMKQDIEEDVEYYKKDKIERIQQEISSVNIFRERIAYSLSAIFILKGISMIMQSDTQESY